jgi:hypothetical protein
MAPAKHPLKSTTLRSQIHKLYALKSTNLTRLRCRLSWAQASQVPPSLGHLSCLEAGNPIIGPGGRYWALASQNTCARQSISTENPLSQCAVCSDNQVQRMDEALDPLDKVLQIHRRLQALIKRVPNLFAFDIEKIV